MARTYGYRHKSRSGGAGWGWRGKSSKQYKYSKHSHRGQNRFKLNEVDFVKYNCKFKSGFNGWIAHRTYPRSTHLANVTRTDYYYQDYKYNERKETYEKFYKRKIEQIKKGNFGELKYYQDALKQIERRGKLGKFTSHRNHKTSNRKCFYQEESYPEFDEKAQQDEQEMEGNDRKQYQI